MSRNSAFADRWLWLILVVALALRSYHLGYPPWDYHNWRQTITLMVARDLARNDFRLFHPQVLWLNDNLPSGASYFNAEFSIQSALAAVLYKLFGESDTAARIVTIAFSLLGICFLYNLLNRRAGPAAARIAALIYSLVPYHLFFGRVFMPDVPALTLALGGLDALDRWTDRRTRGQLAAAAALTAMAVLQKLTVIFVALPALYLFWLADGRRLLTRIEPYVFAAIAGLPSLIWYGRGMAVAQHGGFTLAQPAQIFARDLGLWLQPPFVGQIFEALALEAFSPLGLVLVVIGLFRPLRGRAGWMFRLWLAGAACLLFMIPGILPENHYYLSLLLPGGAALAGLALEPLASHPGTRPVLVLILALFAASAIHSARPFYQPDRSPRDLGVLLNRLTAPEDLIVTESGGSPNMLYFADRRGWMLSRQYDPANLEQLAQAGARYYADSFLADISEQRTFFRKLDARFERLTRDDALWPRPIYRLASPSGPLRELPAGEIEKAILVNFGDQIGLRGISLRRLLDWPASFEVTCYWQCLKEPAANLQIFVHITNRTGQIVYQQDHWPLNGHLPTSSWKAGDVVREKYVMALPEALPGGDYQMRLGWFDPITGSRLPILGPGAPGREDRALVGEIEVPRPPTYGWYKPD
jgi:4-amino-4-deoxy-L-arabinose transferase-like glycosyltransferase